jgi:hypothetical protein
MTRDVWSIRTELQLEKHAWDLVMFDLAIDSKRRGRDVLRLKVEDVARHRITVDRPGVRQRKTGHDIAPAPSGLAVRENARFGFRRLSADDAIAFLEQQEQR